MCQLRLLKFACEDYRAENSNAVTISNKLSPEGYPLEE